MQITPEQIVTLSQALKDIDVVQAMLKRAVPSPGEGLKDTLCRAATDVQRVLNDLKREASKPLSGETRKMFHERIQQAEAEARAHLKRADTAEIQVRSLTAENQRLRQELRAADATLKSVNLGRNC